MSCFACGDSGTDMPTTPTASRVTVNVANATVVEGAGTSALQFELSTTSNVEAATTIAYTLSGITAEPSVDFDAAGGQVEIPAGSNKATISVPVIDDAINEVDEKLMLTFTEEANLSFSLPSVIGVIRDNDQPVYDETGYTTAETYFGYNMEWSDEFSGDALNLDDFNFDLGDGCPNLCGWGNNELEWYTNEEKNIFLEDGKLVIRALKEGSTNYTSAKIHTKDKQHFQFGRLDIRAKMPEGQGLWPAIWLLGQNIDEVGWPASGEIDIMELVGHDPNKAHGTAHWGPQGGNNKSSGSALTLGEKFSERFHVFSLVWEINELVWYVDEMPMHTINRQNFPSGDEYRFNQAFYMILNVAVGGNWPGNPDATTSFPQQMEVDYIRYFKQ